MLQDLPRGAGAGSVKIAMENAGFWIGDLPMKHGDFLDLYIGDLPDLNKCDFLELCKR